MNNMNDKRTVYILASFTVDPVAEYLKKELDMSGIEYDVKVGPYFQIIQELSDYNSFIYDEKCDIVVVWMRFIEFFEKSIAKGSYDTDVLLSQWDEYLDFVVNAAQETNKRFVVIMPAMLMKKPLGTGDVNVTNGITYLQERARCIMMDKFESYKDIILCDEENFFLKTGITDGLSAVMYATAKIPYTEYIFEDAGHYIASAVAIKSDEPEILIDVAMLVDENYDDISKSGFAEKFEVTSDDFMHDIQIKINMLHNWGKRIHLCTVLSDSEFEKVLNREDVFLSEGLLKKAVTSVNSFEDSVKKIRADYSQTDIICISTQENIKVQDAEVICVSDDPEKWIDSILSSGRIDCQPEITSKKRNSSKLVKNEKKDFFSSLNVVVKVKTIDENSMDDILHLVENSRDFRFSQSVYTKDDVLEVLKMDNAMLYGAYINDRFGDYGLGALAVLEVKENVLIITDLMLSCRVLGKKVEDIFINNILNVAREQSCTNIKAFYINTGRNEIAEKYLRKMFGIGAEKNIEDIELICPVENVSVALTHNDTVENEHMSTNDKHELTMSYLQERWASYPEDIKYKFENMISSVHSAKEIMELINYDVRTDWNSSCEYIAPRNETEQIMVDIWKEILHRDKIGVLDNFFSIGGTSILATQLIVKFREKFVIDLPIRLFFDKSNIEQMAIYVHAHRNTENMDKFNEESIDDYRYNLKTFLKSEIHLDEAIQPISNAKPLSVSECKVALLTGATGFLGAFLLQELFDKTDMDVICLVRVEDKEKGLKRIVDNLTKYLIWNDEYYSRLDVVCGDLSKPLLGMTQKDFDELSEKIDVIYHNGANTNFLNPYAMLKSCNVGGTEEILRMAVTKKPKHVEYVSTHYVFSTISNDDGTLILEDRYPDENEIVIMGYQQTKLVCEQLVRIARERGISISIYRVGRISGSSKTGACQTGDFVWLMTKCCVESGIMFSESMNLELIPVDYVASAIVAASLNPKSVNRNFHLINSRRTPIQYVTKWMDERGFKITAYPYMKWKDMMTEIVSKDDSLKTVMTMLPFVTEDTVEFDKQLNLDTRNIDEVLEGTGIERMEVGKELFEKCLDYFIKIGFFKMSPNSVEQKK